MFVVLGNAEGAIKSFATIDPFLTDRIPSEIQAANDTPGIVPIMTDRVARSGVLAVSRIWDDSKAAISLRKLMKSFEKLNQYHDAESKLDALQRFQHLERSDPVSRVRSFRKKFLAHSSGEEQDYRNDVTANEMKTLLLDTTDVLSSVWQATSGGIIDYRYRYQYYADNAYFDWCKLLNITPIEESDNPEEVFVIPGEA